MHECFNCHKEIGDVTFCGHCGERQVCQECGVQFDRMSSFCLDCGTKREGGRERVDQPSQTIAETEEQTGSTNQAGENSFVDSMKQRAQKLGKRNLSIIGGILIVLIAFFIFQGSSDSPEKVVEEFFTVLSDGDVEKIEQYVDPLVWEEMLDEDVLEAMEMLGKLDVTMELLELEQVDTGEDYIDFEVTIKYNSVFIDDEDEEELVSVEVMQYGDKWYISDVY